MFELLKPAIVGQPTHDYAHGTRYLQNSTAADVLSAGEIVLLVSALLSLATSIGLTVTVL
ncbi:MAG: hypothetical protein ACR2PZ_19410 [Pseudomonadales bacterium]